MGSCVLICRRRGKRAAPRPERVWGRMDAKTHVGKVGAARDLSQVFHGEVWNNAQPLRENHRGPRDGGDTR